MKRLWTWINPKPEVQIVEVTRTEQDNSTLVTDIRFLINRLNSTLQEAHKAGLLIELYGRGTIDYGPQPAAHVNLIAARQTITYK